MTSSLVGSEMCIRDRRIGFAHFAPIQVKHAWVPGITGEGSKSPSLTTVSVSYTHLTLPTICSV
eukprot:2509143-Prorocentrum_lima.AAC.1